MRRKFVGVTEESRRCEAKDPSRMIRYIGGLGISKICLHCDGCRAPIKQPPEAMVRTQKGKDTS